MFEQTDEEYSKSTESKDYVMEPLEILGVEKFDDSAVIVRARIKTLPIKQWEVGRIYNKAIKEKFDTKVIEIPFPQTTIQVMKKEISE